MLATKYLERDRKLKRIIRREPRAAIATRATDQATPTDSCGCYAKEIPVERMGKISAGKAIKFCKVV